MHDELTVRQGGRYALYQATPWLFLSGSFFGSLWFWYSQLIDYSVSTQGLLLSFPVLGALCIAVLATLSLEDARQAALTTRVLAWALFWVYVSIFTMNAIVVVAAIVLFGARPGAVDWAVVAITVTGLGLAFSARRFSSIRQPEGRFWLGIAFKVVPQYGQGILFLSTASAISFGSIVMLPLLILCRFFPAQARIRQDANSANQAAYRLVWHDLVCGFFVLAAWVVGQILY